MAELLLNKIDLRAFLQSRAWSVDDLAREIGDEPTRISAVLAGKEVLGKTASLALFAVENNLSPISK